MILLGLFERAALMLMVLFFLGRTRLFKNVGHGSASLPASSQACTVS